MIEGIDRRISKLALGTAFYKLDNKAALSDILDDFIEQGGTVIDTGRHYGESEDVIGLWMESRGVRDRVILSTKGGHGKNHGVDAHVFAGTIERELTTSLERLRTDQVDLYMLHRDSPTVSVAEIMDCLNGELNRGRVHSLGASNWTYDRIAEANDYAYNHNLKGFSVASNNISLAVPAEPFYPGLISVDKTGEEWHQQSGIPLIVWSSQARGFFTGSFTPQMRTSNVQDGFTARMVEVYGTDDNFERLRRAAELGERKGGYSATQIALAYLLYKPFPLVPIVGAHNKDELKSCFQAVSIQMTQQEIEWLNLAGKDGTTC
ncbi:MAG: aldo/keto reductase [Candidatus Latescibacteria bacterium]|nr:aldo/keto reductase [Candidatus Latescibacterota bacterium]